jgi:iron complex outermembrane receptor protein
LYTVQDDHDQIQGQVLNIPASFNSWGVFAEGTQKISDQLSLTAGLREDYVQRVGDSLSPRAAIVIDPTKEDTIKVLYGRAFRVPNLYELLYSAPGYNDPNPNLKPEVLDTYEVVWERQFQSGWRTTLDGYVWRMHNAMEDVTLADGAVQTQNGPSVWAHGIEAEIDKRWTTGANLRAYGSYTRAEHDEVEQTESPQWIFGVAAAIPVFNNRTFLSIDSQIVGPQKSDLQQYTDATYITNVIFTSRDFWKGWNFQVGVYDLFANHARFPRGGPFNQIQPTLNWPDTSFLVSLTCKF